MRLRSRWSSSECATANHECCPKSQNIYGRPMGGCCSHGQFSGRTVARWPIVRSAVVSLWPGKIPPPPPPRPQLSYIDDVTYLPGTLTDFHRMVHQLAPAGVHTHLHSSPLKVHIVAVHKQASAVKYQNPQVVFFFGGGALHIMQAKDCIRLFGRHALTPVFHRDDYIKLLSVCRRASMALKYTNLPSRYPILMYNAAGGGIQGWMSGLRPPTYSTQWV